MRRDFILVLGFVLVWLMITPALAEPEVDKRFDELRPAAEEVAAVMGLKDVLASAGVSRIGTVRAYTYNLITQSAAFYVEAEEITGYVSWSGGAASYTFCGRLPNLAGGHHLVRADVKLELLISEVLVKGGCSVENLITLATKGKRQVTRLGAVHALRDETSLARIVREAADSDVRSATEQKIKEIQRLTRIATDSTANEGSRIEAMNNPLLTDQSIFATAAMSCMSNLASCAINRLIDQTMIAKVALTAEEPSVRMLATEKLTDQSVLEEIAKNEKNEMNLRQAAIKRLTDSTLLVSIAKHKNPQLRACAAGNKNFADQALLTAIATKDKDWWVRKNAVKNESFTDQTVLSTIAFKDREEYVREAAMEKLTDKALLVSVATKEANAYARAGAVANKNLTDQALLADIAVKDKAAGVRWTAVHRLTDRVLLETIAANVKEELFVRKAAQERLSELQGPK